MKSILERCHIFQLLCMSFCLSFFLIGALNLILTWLSMPSVETCYLISDEYRGAFEQCKQGLIDSYSGSFFSVSNFTIGPISLASVYFDINLLDKNYVLATLLTLIVVVTSCCFFYFAKKRIIFLNNAEFLAIIIFSAIMWVKGAVIDVDVMALSGELAYQGVNPFTLAKHQAEMGLLPTFPYFPPCLLGFSLCASITHLFDFLCIPIRDYSVLSVIIGLSYVIMCKSLVDIVSHVRQTINKDFLFFVFLLNPLGLYYVVVLTQLDILAIGLIVYSIKLYLENSRAWFFIAFSALFFIKLQYITIFVILVFALLLLANSRASTRKIILQTCAACLAVLFVIVIYSIVPDCLESLLLNPQAQRVNWSTWWSYFNDGLQINRPIGFVVIYLFLMAVFIGNKNTTREEKSIVLLFVISGFVGLFQSSFAHTFGFTAFMVPALMLVPLCFHFHKFKMIIFYFIPIFLLCTWGTGVSGQGILLNMFGLTSNFVFGAAMATKLFTIEYILHICFALLCFRLAYQISEKKISI